MAVGVFGYGQTSPQKPAVSTLGTQAADLFTGSPAPFLPQILGPLPDPKELASTFESIMPAQQPTSFFSQAQQAINAIPKPAPVTAPVVAPVTVAFPEGDANKLQAALFNSQFQPVERELARRGAIEDRNLNASLAQSGLADSGVGVGQRQRLGREVGEQIGSAAAAISESATARALEAKLTVATQQANIDIQRNLANAQLDLAAQQTNARSLLERGGFEANALMTALGLDAQQGENIRANFISFIDSQTRAALGQSEIARAALADIFNGVLQEAANQLRAREIALGERREANRAGEAQQELVLQDKQLAIQEGQLAQNEQRLASEALMGAGAIYQNVGQGNAEQGAIAATLADYGGANIPYVVQNPQTGNVMSSTGSQAAQPRAFRPRASSFGGIR